MSWFIKCLSNYANFNGRARRKEYWMFILFYWIFYIAAAIIDVIIAGITDSSIAVVTWLYILAMLLPLLAAQARRLHDIGKSGFWIFISFIPIAGAVILLIFMCTDGEARTNQYGPDPKGRNGGFDTGNISNSFNTFNDGNGDFNSYDIR